MGTTHEHAWLLESTENPCAPADHPTQLFNCECGSVRREWPGTDDWMQLDGDHIVRQVLTARITGEFPCHSRTLWALVQYMAQVATLQASLEQERTRLLAEEGVKDPRLN